MPIVITPRDERVLHLLGRYRVMTLKQIREACFTSLSIPLVQRRLTKLRLAKLIRSFPFGVSGTNAWTLTAEGARASAFDPKCFSRPPNTNTVPHDLIVTEYGLRMNVHPSCSLWTAAHELQRDSKFAMFKGRMPDASFKWEGLTKSWSVAALEIENSTKDNRRLKEIAWEYFRMENFCSDVFIAWRSPGLRRRLEEKFREVFEEVGSHLVRVWFSDYSLNDGLCFDFTSLTGEKLSLVSTPVTAPLKADNTSGASLM